jgi:hypothetical protein
MPHLAQHGRYIRHLLFSAIVRQQLSAYAPVKLIDGHPRKPYSFSLCCYAYAFLPTWQYDNGKERAAFGENREINSFPIVPFVPLRAEGGKTVSMCGGREYRNTSVVDECGGAGCYINAELDDFRVGVCDRNSEIDHIKPPR